MAVITPEVRLKRQINYTIIRKLWKYIKSCVQSDNPKDDLYSVLPFTRNIYTHLVNGNEDNTPTISKTRKAKLLETGLPIEVFTGEKQIELDGITLEQWKEYFKYRYTMMNNGADKYKRDGVMNDLNKKLNHQFETIRKYPYESDIFKLYYFIETGEKLKGDHNKLMISNCLNELSKFSINQWELLETQELEKCKKLIEEQLHTIKTLYDYRTLKNKKN